MPRLEDLRVELSKEDPEKLRERLRQIRSDRRISKTPTKVRKAVVKQKDKVVKAVAGLTVEQLEELMKGL